MNLLQNSQTNWKYILIIIILALAVGGIFWWQKDDISRLFFGESPKACTQEAKQCPDGSYVGRTGPNCEFAPCPEPSACTNLCGDGICQEIVCLAIGCPCAETKESCPQDCSKIDDGINLKTCITAADCACGLKIGTNECFFGNKNYVNTLVQCPDFCTGIDGKMRIKCINNTCVQIRE